MVKAKKEKTIRKKEPVAAKVKKTAVKVTKTKATTRPKGRPAAKVKKIAPVLKKRKPVAKKKEVSVKEAPVILEEKTAKPVQVVLPPPKIEVVPPPPAPRQELEVPVAPVPPPTVKELELEFPLTVKDLAVKLQEKPSGLIKILMDMKMMVGINQTLEESVAETICKKFGFKIKKALSEEELALSIHRQSDSPKDLHPRSPIVTLMGQIGRAHV